MPLGHCRAMSDRGRPIYPGGFPAIVRQMEARREPLGYAPGEALPPLDVSLEPLKTTRVDPDAPDVAGSTSSYARKRRDLSAEFAGQPELLLLHGLLIANLRRRDYPDHAPALFQRLWAEQSGFLLASLDARWLVSAITTFGDHGHTDAQRHIGQSLSMLFAMMKLYETERVFSDKPPDQPHDWTAPPKSPLALGMDRYAIVGGGLDVNLLAGLWQQARDDRVIAPLACHLLELLIRDDRTVFARLRKMRAKRKTQRAAASRQPPAGADRGSNPAPVPGPKAQGDARTPPRWGLVSLVRAPLAQIARFAAHHLSLGAARLYLHLDAPDPAAAVFLAQHPAIEVITCDDTYWNAQKKPRMEQHQLRQLWVATRTYRRTDLDWLAHVDVDEFMLPPAPMGEMLAQVDRDTAAVLMPPVEQLAGGDDTLFKTTARMAGRDKSVLEDIYPTFGPYLRGGYLSHLEGKLIARTGIPEVRLGLHALLYRGTAATNIAPLNGFYIGHAHATDWNSFRRRLDYRLDHGSYKKRGDSGFRLHDMLQYLRREEGEEGLRSFFSEVCEATPELVSRLRHNDMLIARNLDLDAKVRDIFGTLPEG
ncbi:MAG: glycosyltransferase family 2 protein [Sediminimonas qiaohouensis]|uniref:Glycosyltransferase family 2 protein n=2 Tax=Sediminimonas qiaohouensis TaxID=552061 RepID=A0A7C9HBT1_9RHOB|nr:glycosyltransferase family 2 protein [Sediminimonas qiaohouensis]